MSARPRKPGVPLLTGECWNGDIAAAACPYAAMRPSYSHVRLHRSHNLQLHARANIRECRETGSRFQDQGGQAWRSVCTAAALRWAASSTVMERGKVRPGGTASTGSLAISRPESERWKPGAGGGRSREDSDAAESGGSGWCCCW